ncbi:hypothetical protein Tco_0483331 [Tanacetum coccineum]
MDECKKRKCGVHEHHAEITAYGQRYTRNYRERLWATLCGWMASPGPSTLPQRSFSGTFSHKSFSGELLPDQVISGLPQNLRMAELLNSHTSRILNDGVENVNVLNNGFAIVAAAATGNAVIKESFVELHIDELMVNVTRKHGKGSIPSLYDAIRVLLAADDNRVVASQSLKDGLSSLSLISATIALKAIAVNQPVFDELKELLGELLCIGDQGNVKGVAPEMGESVAENGGIDSLLVCIDDAGVQGNNSVAKACCTLLSKGRVEQAHNTFSRLADDPFVIQEDYHMYTLLAIARKLAIEAGAGDLAIQSMQTFPEAYQLQKNSCLIIHNLVARNLENKSIFHCVLKALLVCLLIISFGFYNISLSLHMTLLLGKGIEKIIRPKTTAKVAKTQG